MNLEELKEIEGWDIDRQEYSVTYRKPFLSQVIWVKPGDKCEYWNKLDFHFRNITLEQALSLSATTELFYNDFSKLVEDFSKELLHHNNK